MIEDILINRYKYEDEIYIGQFDPNLQNVEFEMRKKIAQMSFNDYLNEISNFHSIEVMDNEVKKFLNKLKKDSIILDLGCGWCWHWRNVDKYRPDIKIVAFDFIKENFYHARKILSKETQKQFYFVNDDMHNLNFKDNTFDAIWTVQVFQHIKQLTKVLEESNRVLKEEGIIYNYHLNNSILVKLKDFFFKKKNVENYYYLNRDINLYLGKKNSLFSIIDSKISNNRFLGPKLGRQVLIKTKK